MAPVDGRRHMHDRTGLIVRLVAGGAGPVLATQGQVDIAPLREVAPRVLARGVIQHDATGIGHVNAIVHPGLVQPPDARLHRALHIGVNGTGKACPVKCCRRCDGPGLDGRHIGGIGREVASRQLGQHMGGIDQRVLHHLTCTGLDFGREDLQDEQRRQPVDQEKAEQQAQSQTDTESALHGVAGSVRL